MTQKASEDFSDCRETRQVHRSALADPRFRGYYPASWFSSLGAWLLRFLLGWSAWDLTHSATWVGIVGALMLAPALLLSPWFGILSVRVNPREGLRLSMVIHSAITLTGTLTTWLGWYDRAALLALAALSVWPPRCIHRCASPSCRSWSRARRYPVRWGIPPCLLILPAWWVLLWGRPWLRRSMSAPPG